MHSGVLGIALEISQQVRLQLSVLGRICRLVSGIPSNINGHVLGF